MAFDLKTAEAEGKLNRRLEDLETLRKSIAPELVEALADGPAYEGNIFLISDDDMFRIDYRQLGQDRRTIIDVKFASATPTGDYKVTWLDRMGNKITSEMVGRPDLVDTIEAMIYAANRR